MFFGRKGPDQGISLCDDPVSEKKEKPLRVGGQAVIEGVMMRSPKSMAIAVRKPNGEIVVKREGLSFFSEKTFLFKLPLGQGGLDLAFSPCLGDSGPQFLGESGPL